MRDLILQRVHELVSIESPSNDTSGNAQLTDLLATWLHHAGLTVRRIISDNGVHLQAELSATDGSGADQPLLLLGHSDTVWPIGTIDSDVPWSVDGDIVRGPGVYDMKSGLVVMVTALDLIRDRPHGPVRVFISCDEEIGSPAGRTALQEAAAGVRGVIGFEPPHPDGALKIGRRGSTRVRLAVEGIAAHAALDPTGGVSAIDELVDQLIMVRAAASDPTLPHEVLCNVGTITGGTRANVIAAHAEAELGLRFIDAGTEKTVLDRVLHPAPVRDRAKVAATLLSHRPAWAPNDADRSLLDHVRAAGHPIGQDIQGRPAAGAGDTNFTGAARVPSIDGFGPVGGDAHAVAEHASLQSVMERVKLLDAVLTQMNDSSLPQSQ